MLSPKTEFWPQPERWAGVPMVEGGCDLVDLAPDHAYVLAIGDEWDAVALRAVGQWRACCSSGQVDGRFDGRFGGWR